jgi:hypothetical protein
MPGRVETYDPATQRASVAPLVKDVEVDDEGARTARDFPVITGVPVVFPGAGGFRVTFPVQAGDLVLLVFSDRSLDKLLASSGAEAVDPIDPRQHDLSDAVAIPGLHTFGSPLASAPTDGATIGAEGGPQIKFEQAALKLGLGAAEAAALGNVLASALFDLVANLDPASGILSNPGGLFFSAAPGAPCTLNPAVVPIITAWAAKYLTTPATNILSAKVLVER